MMDLNSLANKVVHIDSFLPPEMALKAEEAGITKAQMGPRNTFALGVLAGAFIALGAIFATTVSAGAGSHLSYGVSKIFPISAFVAAGFEHCVANMYFIPAGLFVKAWAPASFWNTIDKTASEYINLTWYDFFIVNLFPVTIGNILGGSVMVGIVYWFIYIRKAIEPERPRLQ